VQFLGRVSDDRLREEYRSARALLFPQVEDFGIVAAEALACGLPVVARARGGALDIVTDAVTGAFFLGDSPHALAGAVARCPRNADHACRIAACAFREARFLQAFAHVARHTLAAR
jgi:glycosyltransferase involved in cell wall biosynthesis